MHIWYTVFEDMFILSVCDLGCRDVNAHPQGCAQNEVLQRAMKQVMLDIKLADRVPNTKIRL